MTSAARAIVAGARDALAPAPLDSGGAAASGGVALPAYAAGGGAARAFNAARTKA